MLGMPDGMSATRSARRFAQASMVSEPARVVPALKSMSSTMRAKALGAQVIVTEVDPVKAIEARMDGFSVMPMVKAAEQGDFFVTVTGCNKVITTEHFPHLKDGAILANAGHFNVEVDMAALEAEAVDKYEARKNITAYVMPWGKTIHVIGEGKLANIAAADGHPAEIMDLSFAVQCMGALYVKEHYKELPKGVVDVSKTIDEQIARRKLAAWGTEIDTLTDEQVKYLNSWEV